MTKTDRIYYANILTEAFQAIGASTNYTERSGEKRGTVDARWYDPKTNKLILACMVWIGTIGGGGHTVTLHWYEAKSRLNPEVMHNVNAYHGTKATSGFVAEDYTCSCLLAAMWLKDQRSHFNDGTVFLPVPVNG